MTYPARSNFWSGDPGSAWWRHRADGQTFLCASQARTIVRQLQRNLRERLPFTWTYQGLLGSAATMTADGNLGAMTFTGLMRLADDLDLPELVRANLSADFARCVSGGRAIPGSQGQPLSLATTAVATWVGVDSERQWSELEFSRDATTLRFSLDTPDDGAATDTWHCVPMENVGHVMPDTPIVGTPPASETSGGAPIPPWVFALIGGGLYLAFGKNKKGRR